MTHKWKWPTQYAITRERNPARCTREGCGVLFYYEERERKAADSTLVRIYGNKV